MNGETPLPGGTRGLPSFRSFWPAAGRSVSPSVALGRRAERPEGSSRMDSAVRRLHPLWVEIVTT
jgi:hypothetical protein